MHLMRLLTTKPLPLSASYFRCIDTVEHTVEHWIIVTGAKMQMLNDVSILHQNTKQTVYSNIWISNSECMEFFFWTTRKVFDLEKIFRVKSGQLPVNFWFPISLAHFELAGQFFHSESSIGIRSMNEPGVSYPGSHNLFVSIYGVYEVFDGWKSSKWCIST